MAFGEAEAGKLKNDKAKNSEPYVLTKDNLWVNLYKKGAETAKKFKITSEKDIDKILHGLSRSVG